MIEVKNLSKNFGALRALDDVSFSIDRGEVVGFLGPNGAGKTTAMRIIAGYLSPSSGSVSIDGEEISEDPIGSKAKFGYLPEHPPVYPEMYVEDYLDFVASIKGVSKEKRKSAVEEAMEAVMITDRRGQIIKTLSKGYKQRVGLAGALVHKPGILILDEPTVGLDPNQIIEIRKLISNLKAEDRTLIISTHILAEVEQTCEKVIIINNGKIAAIDSKDALLKSGEDRVAVELEVARNSAGVKDALSSIEHVQVTGVEGNLIRLSVAPDPGIREQVAKTIVGQDMGLLAMNVSRLALEDIFIRLTQTQDVE